MQKIIADLHTHTLASGHAYGTIMEMWDAAKEAELELLGITEHAPGIQGTCDPFYFINLRCIPRVRNGVTLIHGSEVNVMMDGTLSLDEFFLNRLDYAIVGIHTPWYKDQGMEKNTDNLISCMKHPKVKIVSHPDDDNTPLDYDRLTDAAKEYGVALELNNNSLNCLYRRKNCLENYRKMLKLCMEKGVSIVIDTDAHFPTMVGHFESAEQYLAQQLGFAFDEALILNNDRAKALEFLGLGDLIEAKG